MTSNIGGNDVSGARILGRNEEETGGSTGGSIRRK